MRRIDKRTKVTRRGFLQGTGAAAAGLGALSGGAVLIDPRGAWALSLTALKAETARTLVQAARDIYPHDRLGEAYYAKAIEPFDAQAAKDPALLKLLTDGAGQLDKLASARGAASYADVGDQAAREAMLHAVETTPFFAKLRGDLLTTLYNQPEVWAKFGYEGPSAEKGGYINRGFNDIDWL
jgi:hypothetical protein